VSGWRQVESIDLAVENADLVDGEPTAMVMIHYPDNLDPGHRAKVTMDLMMEGFRRAKPIFAEAGVQLELAAVRTGSVDPSLFEIASTDDPHPMPRARFTGMYRGIERNPHRLSAEAESVFDSMIPEVEDADRIVHLVVLQDVFMTFCEQLDFRTWQWKTISTGGLSFPGYMYGSMIPRHLRGVITITDLTKEKTSWKTVAHELGHKLMNVSHEYRDVAPQHEVRADGGLMLYGQGTEIPEGEAGRFHRERLHVSPFIYRIVDRQRQWNPDYSDSGFYHDPIYDGISIELDPPELMQP
jgi:hypothetical protein